MSDTSNSNGNWGGDLLAGGAGGVLAQALFGNGGIGGGARAPGVTGDQVDSKLAAMEGRMERDALGAAVAALGAQVNTNQAATSNKLCEIDSRILMTAASTDAKIAELGKEILFRELAATQARVVELQNAGHHAATQNIIVNAQASASSGTGCNTQLLQALQVAAALRGNNCPATASGN